MNNLVYWAVALIFACRLLATAHRLSLQALEQQRQLLTQPARVALSTRERFQTAKADWEKNPTPATWLAFEDAEQALLLELGA